MDDLVVNITNKLNESEFLANVQVPILDGFHVIPNKGTLFTALSEANYIEQFLSDGILAEGDTFEEHVNKVVKDIEKTMKDAGLEDPDENIHFLKDYKNHIFRFKVYVQDNIGKGKVIRQFNMFFVDPDFNAFYQISLASSPYPISELEFVREELTMNMITTINNLMDNVTH